MRHQRRLSVFTVALALVAPASVVAGPAAAPAPAAGLSGLVQVQASPQRLRGKVLLMNRRGTKPARSVSSTDVLVLFAPDQKGLRVQPSVTRPAQSLEMATINKSYQPRVLAVPKGAPVQFPNRDEILHNVFSVSGDNAFDLGLLDGGEARSHGFDEPGLVRIFCNVHRDMVGFVWVLDSPYFTKLDAEGRFLLDGLPPGRGTLTVWHERAEPLEIQIDVSRSADLLDPIELRITRPRLPSHGRKDGSAYRKRQKY